MTDKRNPPHAEKLQIVSRSDDKQILFDFTVEDGQHTLTTMDVLKIPEIFRAVCDLLGRPEMRKVSAPRLARSGYREAEAITPLECGTLITPLGDGVIVIFSLPGSVELGFHLPLRDARKLREAIDAAISRCVERQRLPKQ